MSVWSDIHKRSNGKTVRKEDELIVNEGVDYNLTNEEKEDIKNLLKELYKALRKCDILSIKDEVGKSVELSGKKKTYYELFVERQILPDDKDEKNEATIKEIKAIRVLGEYKDGTIILYVNNIKDAACEQNAPGFNGKPYLTVTRYVYLHELMHAFFDRGEERFKYKYNREDEEGLAEFGALLLLNYLVDATPEGMKTLKGEHASKEELEWAVGHIERKKGVLECYSRGADLFKQYGQDKERSKRMLEAYPNPVE